MIEIPESIILTNQLNKELRNRRIKYLIANSSPHKFAWYNGDPSDYTALFADKVVENVYSYGGKIHIKLSQDCGFMFCEGTNIRYYTDTNKIPKKHQLYIEFDNSAYLVCTIRMYGGIYGYKGTFDNGYDNLAKIKPDILSDEFNLDYFFKLLSSLDKKKVSVKAFLATEQRIPGLGNGVVQDILFNAAINPKRDIFTLDNVEIEKLFYCAKETIHEMVQKGGRDVENDIYGNSGGYKTIMSKNTYNDPCPRCGGVVKKEAYLGGNIYYCTECQK